MEKLHNSSMHEQYSQSQNGQSYQTSNNISYSNQKNLDKQQTNQFIFPFQKYKNSLTSMKNHKKKNQLRTYINLKKGSQILQLKGCYQEFVQLLKENNCQISKIKSSKLFSQARQHSFSYGRAIYCTFFIHIFKLGSSKCHIRIINLQGCIEEYFANIKSLKKFQKIYKFIKKIEKSSLIIIFDQQNFLSKDLKAIFKLSQYSKQICYHSRFSCSDLPLRYQSIKQTIVFEEQKVYETGNNHYAFIKNDIFWYFSDLFYDNGSIDFENNLLEIRRIQRQIESKNDDIFSKEMKQHSSIGLNFILESILINFSKTGIFERREQIYKGFGKIIEGEEDQKIERKRLDFGDVRNHYVEYTQRVRECVNCLTKYKEMGKRRLIDEQQIRKMKKEVRKSKYRCEGCSAREKKEVNICIECMEEYHKYLQKQRRCRQQRQKGRLQKKQKLKNNEETLKIDRVNQNVEDYERSNSYLKIQEESPFDYQYQIQQEEDQQNNQNIGQYDQKSNNLLHKKIKIENQDIIVKKEQRRYTLIQDYKVHIAYIYGIYPALPMLKTFVPSYRIFLTCFFILYDNANDIKMNSDQYVVKENIIALQKNQNHKKLQDQQSIHKLIKINCNASMDFKTTQNQLIKQTSTFIQNFKDLYKIKNFRSMLFENVNNIQKLMQDLL